MPVVDAKIDGPSFLKLMHVQGYVIFGIIPDGPVSAFPFNSEVDKIEIWQSKPLRKVSTEHPSLCLEVEEVLRKEGMFRVRASSGDVCLAHFRESPKGS